MNIPRSITAILATALAVGLLALVAGCTSDDDAPDLAWPGDGSETEVVDLGAGFTAEVPVSWTVEQPFTVGTEPADECGSVPASIDADGVFLRLGLPAAVCDGDPDAGDVGNDQHGDYVSIEDVLAPGGVATTDTDLGVLTTFTQPYEECTNECVTADDQVALVALARPVEPDRPTLMITAAAADVSSDRMLAMVEAITTE